VTAGVGKALAVLIVVLGVAVVGLDQWQVREGHRSLLGFELLRRAPAAAPSPPPPPLPAPASSSLTETPPRLALVVVGLGANRDAVLQLRALGRPLAAAVRPELPEATWVAGEARRAGMEVLVDLSLEPYRHPGVDPGPGGLTMAMPVEDLGPRVVSQLQKVPGAVGAIHHLGSRMTEDRTRMRAVLAPLAERRLLYVDTLTSNLSVAHDEARRLGIRALRRQAIVDPAAGEGAQRAALEGGAAVARRRGEALIVASADPVTLRLLRDAVTGWEAAGLRLVPVSSLAP